MKTGELVLCSLIVYISITVAVGRYCMSSFVEIPKEYFILVDNNEENYEQLKRILGEKHRGTMGQTGSSSEENSYGICAASNPCEHEGICISKGRRSYYCECTDNYYGKHCEKRKTRDLLY